MVRKFYFIRMHDSLCGRGEVGKLFKYYSWVNSRGILYFFSQYILRFSKRDAGLLNLQSVFSMFLGMKVTEALNRKPYNKLIETSDPEQSWAALSRPIRRNWSECKLKLHQRRHKLFDNFPLIYSCWLRERVDVDVVKRVVPSSKQSVFISRRAGWKDAFN